MIVFTDDYVVLAVLARVDPRLVNVLSDNGAANLTVCPGCHVDDFAHVDGCDVSEAVEKLCDF